MKFALALTTIAVGAAMILQLAQRTRTGAIVISCGAAGLEFDLCKSGALAWGEKNHQTVNVTSAPNDSTERLGLFMQLLASHSNQVDVFTIDTTWGGIIGDFFLDLKPFFSNEEMSEFFPAFIAADTYRERLVAIPWYIDAGLLYYRSDLLNKYNRHVPKTWSELTETAALIQQQERAGGNQNLWGFVFQGRAYEGLTCNALEWIAAYDGGHSLEENGEVSINNPKATAALELARSWIGKISPPGVLNYTEEEARGIFQSGNAVFLRSWPYVYKLAGSKDSAVRDKFAVAPLPNGAAVLGGWSLAIAKTSAHQKEALSLVQWLTSREEQRRRALIGGFYPTRQTLYENAELLKQLPELNPFHTIFVNAFPRPSRIAGAHYNRVSAEFWETVHDTLSGNGDTARNLELLERKLRLMSFAGAEP